MKKIKFFMFAVLFAVMCAGFGSCEKDNGSELVNGQTSYAQLIVGTWKCTSLTGNMDLPPAGSKATFTKEGKLVVDGQTVANYSVLKTADAVIKYGADVDYLPVGTLLVIDYSDDVDGFLIKEMTEDTAVLQGEKETDIATFEKVVPLPDNNTGTSLLVGTWMPDVSNNGGGGGEFKYVFKSNGTVEVYELGGDVDYLFDSCTWTYQDDILTLKGEYINHSYKVTKLTSTKLVFTYTYSLYGQVYSITSTFNKIK